VKGETWVIITNVPPAVMYGAMQQWPVERFRATLQGYFLPAAVLICAGHGLGGLWTRAVLGLYLAAFPCVLLAIFQQLLYGALIVLGLLLLW
jgi:hypothetical protein